jgi:NAD(P)-dependent dehydrogenase (short-subunit alcohol dehydrogenase family)
MTAHGTLAGQVALVTGAAKRLGRETALALAKEGAAVALHAKTSAKEARAVARTIEKGGGKAVVLLADLADPDACLRLVPDTLSALGRLDVLVNNAAVFERTPALEPDAGAFDRHFEVNARAVYLLCAAAGKHMVAARRGTIVNVACASAESPWTGWLPYSASKAAVVSLTKGFAKALAPRVRVNAVAPGAVVPPKGASDRANRAALARTVLGRWGDAKDVARAVLFLVRDAPFTTGAVIPVDGGRHLA